MKLVVRYISTLIVALIILSTHAFGRQLPPEVCDRISEQLTRIAQTEVSRCPVKVESAAVKGGRVVISASVPMSYYPVREDNLAALYDSLRSLLPADLRRHKIEVMADGSNIASNIPLYYRSSRRGIKPFTNRAEGGALVRRERPFASTKGLEGRHIAIWQSHGRYFDNKSNGWRWQRPLLWQTVEDLFTQSYVLPYLVPMLESAGATVLLPRERDFQDIELIADNDRESVDSLSRYVEGVGLRSWQTHNRGFAHRKSVYVSGENPFADGTSRFATTVDNSRQVSRAIWSVEFPKSGEYAVYVSYCSFAESASDALYTINHSGGASRVRVNQRIGGGTWVYVGTYHFESGRNYEVVTLSNLSAKKGRIVSADAVKIGGGMGNIARTVCDSLQVAGGDYTPIVSGMPRYCEGARYWLQWAGFSEEVYNQHRNSDDYKDDYKSRGEWVNALMGGSNRLSKRDGLGVPIDMSLAFHSDAGVTDNDATIGTLGIYYTKLDKGRFEDGEKRTHSRDLTDMVMSQIVADVRRSHDSDWSRRGMWNRSYFEARVPSVPAMLLELLSHQNQADMRLGSDPMFKFTVSRAIYKAVLRYLSAQYNRPYCVAPLPVEAFSAKREGGAVRLSWSPTVDSLEASARPTAYVVYTRRGDKGFDGGVVVKDTTLLVQQERGVVYGYRVCAINDGGESFPSEILSACLVSNDAPCALIVNGFNRVAAPAMRSDGFHNEFDSGVAYLRDVAFVGEQRIHDASKRRLRNEYMAFGASHNNYEGGIVGGNAFDYPALHGRSIVECGYSFVSASALSVERGDVSLADYDFVDLVLGKQRATEAGRDFAEIKYRCFTPAMQSAVEAYIAGGGAMMVSGAYVATDLFESVGVTKADERFAKEVLHLSLVTNMATRSYAVTTRSRLSVTLPQSDYKLSAQYSPDHYAINSVDALMPVGEGAYPLMRYEDSGLCAAVGYRGSGAVVVMGFPFEGVVGVEARNELMRGVVDFLNDKPNR